MPRKSKKHQPRYSKKDDQRRKQHENQKHTTLNDELPPIATRPNLIIKPNMFMLFMAINVAAAAVTPNLGSSSESPLEEAIRGKIKPDARLTPAELSTLDCEKIVDCFVNFANHSQANVLAMRETLRSENFKIVCSSSEMITASNSAYSYFNPKENAVYLGDLTCTEAVAQLTLINVKLFSAAGNYENAIAKAEKAYHSPLLKLTAAELNLLESALVEGDNKIVKFETLLKKQSSGQKLTLDERKILAEFIQKSKLGYKSTVYGHVTQDDYHTFVEKGYLNGVIFFMNGLKVKILDILPTKNDKYLVYLEAQEPHYSIIESIKTYLHLAQVETFPNPYSAIITHIGLSTMSLDPIAKEYFYGKAEAMLRRIFSEEVASTPSFGMGLRTGTDT